MLWAPSQQPLLGWVRANAEPQLDPREEGLFLGVPGPTPPPQAALCPHCTTRCATPAAKAGCGRVPTSPRCLIPDVSPLLLPAPCTSVT